MQLTSFFKRCSQVVCLLTILILVDRFCHKKTGGFTLPKIESNHPAYPKWDTQRLSSAEQNQLLPLLQQKFTFLSYGGQSYVFLSEDKSTVLKLFKQHHLRVPPWIQKLPLPKPLKKYRNKFIHRREEKFDVFFDSCKLAFDLFKERTGLIYIHLNPTDHLHQKLTLIDKLGIAHTIDLDRTDFVLQHRARLAPAHFRHLKKKNDLAGAKESLDSLLNLMVERSQKGIADRDPNLRRNCGFIDNHAVEIDIGSYTQDPTLSLPFAWKNDVYQKSLQLRRMIRKQYPELSDYLEQQLHERLLSHPSAL